MIVRRMVIKKFLIESKNEERASYIWNMAGSMLVAFQSVIMLMILTRVLGLQEAGIFTIAYANANLFLTIGKYGMRNFQVSDVKDQFSFSDYRASRIITAIAMAVVSIVYVLYTGYQNSYTADKSMVIIWMCLLKVVDALEDVFHGLYQQKNRLDIAGKALTMRMLITILIFGICIIFVKDLLIVVVVVTLISAAVFILFTFWTFGVFQIEKKTIDWMNICQLLRLCFPLFLGAFLSMYIGNAPKYAIDAVLSDELQACYGFIAMPVFVIGLLNGFIFNPMLHKMSLLWSGKKIKEFVLRALRQVGIVAVITITCIVGAYFLGIPVLSWLYNTELSPYKTELLILLLGGGFLGLAGFLNILLTIVRRQKSLMWGYITVALAAYLLSDKIVASYGIFGAAILYMMLMGALCLVFAGLLVHGMAQSKVTDV